MAQNIEISSQKSSYRTMSRNRSKMSRNRSFSARRFPVPSRPPQAPLRACSIHKLSVYIAWINLFFSIKKRLGTRLERPQLEVDEQQIYQPSEKAGRGQQEVTAIENEILTKLTNSEVNEYLTFLPVLQQHFRVQIQHFKGGRVAHFCKEWEKNNSDCKVLDIVRGQRIEFDTEPFQNSPRLQSNFTDARMRRELLYDLK